MHACVLSTWETAAARKQEDSMAEVNLGYIERMRPVSAGEQDSVNKAKQIINMCTNKTNPTTKKYSTTTRMPGSSLPEKLLINAEMFAV